jgi:hypothetical protein
MRRGLALTRDYAKRREAFGALLAHQPLHADTLAWLQAETEAAFHLSFTSSSYRRDESGDIAPPTPTCCACWPPSPNLPPGGRRSPSPAKCWRPTAARATSNTGLPLLLRDSQVMPIWEVRPRVGAAIRRWSAGRSGAIAAPPGRGPVEAAAQAEAAIDHARHWLRGAAAIGLP